MYCFDNCCNSGYTVVPQTVVAYNYDADWIIAKSDPSFNNSKNDFSYWIFRKSFSSSKENIHDSIQKNLTGPLDSLTFYKMLSENKVHLQLMNY